MRAPDAAFADPRLAALYDLLDDDRSDLDTYEVIVSELGAERVADVGCGTGSLAARLAGLGFSVVGVDPAVPRSMSPGGSRTPTRSRGSTVTRPTSPTCRRSTSR